MRFLGIDYGAQRVGVALSDEAGKFAMPHRVLSNAKNAKGAGGAKSVTGTTGATAVARTTTLAEEIADIARKNGVTDIVLGESKNYKGEPNAILARSLEFKKELEAMKNPDGAARFVVHLEPEYMTSAQAERLQGKNDLLDASAAAIILQSFLDSSKNTKGGQM